MLIARGPCHRGRKKQKLNIDNDNFIFNESLKHRSIKIHLKIKIYL